MVSDNGQILTIQAHPEFESPYVKALLLRRQRLGILTDKFVQERLPSFEDQTVSVDSIWFGAKILDFIFGNLSIRAQL